MAKLKKKGLKEIKNFKRDVFPRKAKEQSIVNLEKLAVIMEVIEASSAFEDNINGGGQNVTKKRKRKTKLKKLSESLQIELKEDIAEEQSPSSLPDHYQNIYNSNESINQKSRRPKAPVLLSNTGGLSHFMELGARTDLLCNSPMVDPLGPDSFDNFQWVEVKEELPDDIEVCNVTLTELPLKAGDPKLSNVDHSSQNGTVPYNQQEINNVSNEGQNDLSEVDNNVSEDSHCKKPEDTPEMDESLDENTSNDDSSSEMYETENNEETPSKKKKKNIPQVCDICGKKLSSKGSLYLHKLKKHKLKIQFTCELCGQKFDFQRKVVQHRNSVHRGEDRRFSCDVCSKRFLDYHSFLLHIKSHVDKCKEEEGSDKICKDCDKAFRDDESLKIHQVLIHRVELRENLKSQEKNFICHLCGKRFAFGCLLRDHMNLHTGSRPYLCQGCGKAFAQKATLKKHSKTHSDVRPFQCSECPQGFYGKGDFIKHQRKHTGERPYICEMCGEGFSRSTHLGVHRRTHTGERPHTCDLCGRGFTKRGDVVRHRRIHTGELPYLCQVCGKAFRQSTQCANHIKSQHPDSPALVAKNPNPLHQRVQSQLFC